MYSCIHRVGEERVHTNAEEEGMADVLVHEVPQLIIIISCTKQRALETTANTYRYHTHTDTTYHFFHFYN